MTQHFDVDQFHRQMGIADYPEEPRLLDREMFRFRFMFMLEELAEFAHASGYPDVASALRYYYKDSGVHDEKGKTCLMEDIDRDYASNHDIANGTPKPAEPDLVKAFDALLDLSYVLHGTGLYMGILPGTWSEGWRAVHRANMQKRRAASVAESAEKTGRAGSKDVVKPEGWVGPEEMLEYLLRSEAAALKLEDADKGNPF